MSLLLLALLAVGPVELEKPIDPWLASAARSRVSAEDLTMIAENPQYVWWSVRYYPTEKVENWASDTLEVVGKDGQRFRAVKQFGVFQDHRLTPLAGLVPNSDLYRKAGRRGQGVVLLVGFRERFSLKNAVKVEVR